VAATNHCSVEVGLLFIIRTFFPITTAGDILTDVLPEVPSLIACASEEILQWLGVISKSRQAHFSTGNS
jgi:hypothetical protein